MEPICWGSSPAVPVPEGNYEVSWRCCGTTAVLVASSITELAYAKTDLPRLSGEAPIRVPRPSLGAKTRPGLRLEAAKAARQEVGQRGLDTLRLKSSWTVGPIVMDTVVRSCLFVLYCPRIFRECSRSGGNMCKPGS